MLAAATLVLAAAIAIGVRALVPAGPAAPDFTLTDQAGRPYTLSAHRGHPIALFFGFTHCTDACPATLASLARAKRELGSAAAGFDVVLVTVDPARDTAPVLARYLRAFDPAFVGLTGTAAQLAPVYAAYHVYRKLDPPDRHGDYDIEHSAAVQFIAPSGRLRGLGDPTDTPDELAALVKQARG
jgi:protein SCO1/2